MPNDAPKAMDEDIVQCTHDDGGHLNGELDLGVNPWEFRPGKQNTVRRDVVGPDFD